MAKDEGISVALRSVKTKVEADELMDAIQRQLSAMSAAQVRKTFMGMTGATTSATTAMTGLRAALGASPLPDPWRFGTIHRNKISDEVVMAVGHRQVVGLGPHADEGHVTDTVDDWFDYWEVEQDT